jgi:hypothetical protein
MDSQSQERPRNLRPTLVAVLALSLVGCPKPSGSGGTTSPEDPFAGVKEQILRVAIDTEQAAHPDPVKVKKKVEIVVWVAPEGTKLKIDFPENPFPQPVICPGGRFCASLLPPTETAAEKTYSYTASLQTSSGTTTVDPKLEVVP